VPQSGDIRGVGRQRALRVKTDNAGMTNFYRTSDRMNKPVARNLHLSVSERNP